MSETVDAEMDATQALDALDELEGYEEALTARTAGLTWMVWGTAIPGLFMTYNAATPWLETLSGFEWILSILWIPWILGASLVTNGLWKATAVTLDWDTDDRRGWAYTLGFTLVFFAIAAGIWAVTDTTGISMGTNAWMLTTTGLLTVAIGLVYRQGHGPGPTEAIVGGLVLALAGVAIAAAALDPPVLAGLTSAGLVGAVYYAMGTRLYLDG